MSYFTYILKCSDGSYYVGHTEDLEDRLCRHNAGRGPAYTVARCPVLLVYSEYHTTKSGPAKRERQIKKWSRAKKQALIEGDPGSLKSHSRCQSLHGKPNSCPNEASKYRPWRIETAISFRSRDKALAFERHLKTHSGRAFATKRL